MSLTNGDRWDVFQQWSPYMFPNSQIVQSSHGADLKGVDAWVTQPDGTTYGLGVRIQSPYPHYQTSTWRRAELMRLWRGVTLCTRAVHMYADSDKLRSYRVIDTHRFIDAIRAGTLDLDPYKMTNTQDGKEFWAIPDQIMSQAGAMMTKDVLPNTAAATTGD